MNEQQQNRTVDLDTHARQAATGLRQSVRDAELGTRAPRPAGGRRLVVLAVAVVVLVGGFVLWSGAGDGEPDEGGIASSGPATPLAPDPVPDGLSFTGAFEGPITSGEDEVLPDFTVYTGPDGSGLSLVGLAATGEPEAGGPEVETVTRAGRDYLVEPLGNGDVVSWSDEATGRVPTLIGQGLSRDELLTAAQSTTVDERGLIDVRVDALEAELTKLATVPYGVAAPMATAMATLDGSGGIGYATSDQSRVLEVTFALAQDGWLEASQALMFEPRSVEVRGQPAYAGGVGDGLTGGTLVWVEPDGTFVRLVGYGLTVDELAAIAETLEPLTPEQWQVLLNRSDPDVGGNDTGSASSGSDSETATTFEAQGQPIEPPDEVPLLNFVPPDTPDGAATLSISGEPATTLTIDPAREPVILHATSGGYLYGAVPENTERLVVSTGGAEIEVTSFHHVRGGGVFPAWAFIVELPDLASGYTLTAFGEDGTVTTAGG